MRVRAHRPPAWLIVTAVVVYSGLFQLSLKNPANSVKSDSQAYLKLAGNLRAHHVFSSADAPPFSPEVYRLPGYPLFLAATNAVTPLSLPGALALQCGMGILLVFIVWPFFYRLGGPLGALFGTVFLCFDLMAILHQDLVMTEALYMLIFSSALCFSILYFERPSWPRAAAAGLTFGFAALIKPIAIIAAALLLLTSFKNWKNALWLGLFTLSLPAGWVVRNWALTGYPVYTIQGNFTLLQYPASCAVAIDTGRTRLQVLEDLKARLRSEGFGEDFNPIPLSRAYKRTALQIMRQHPLGTMKYCASGAIRVLGGTGLEMILDQLPSSPSPQTRPPGSELVVSGSGTWSLLKAHPALIPVQLAYVIFLLGGYFLFGKGIRDLVRKGNVRFAAFLLLSVLIVLPLSTVPGGTYRLRLLLLPFLAFGIAASSAVPPTSSKK